MTDDQILDVGAYARALVENETFNRLYKDYTDGMLSRIVESQPQETKAREFEYAQIRAMTGFIGHLVGLAEAAARIIEKNEAQSLDPDEVGEDIED